MRLVRSWPETVPDHRAHVVDDIDRLVMDGYDYRCLAGLDDDVVVIEWDMAVDYDDLQRFISRAGTEPETVRVAPYVLYQGQSGKVHRPWWAHRRFAGASMRFVQETDPTCHLFGFGLVYLPRPLVVEFLDFWDGHFSDSSFAGWHYKNAPNPEVPIDWDIRPVHLHNPVPRVR